jgi:hypothetical protein
MLTFNYVICNADIPCTDCIKDIGVFLDSKLYFLQQVDYLFPHTIELLGFIRTTALSFFLLRQPYDALQQPSSVSRKLVSPAAHPNGHKYVSHINPCPIRMQAYENKTTHVE